MKKIENVRINPLIAAFIVLVFSIIFYQSFGAIAYILLAGFEIDKSNAGIIRIISSVSQILFLMVFPIIAAKIFYNNINDIFKLKKPSLTEILLSFLGLIFLLVASQSFIFLQTNFLEYLSSISPNMKNYIDFLKNADKLLEQTYQTIISSDNYIDLLSVIVAIAIIPAFCEEFLFRGFVLSSLEQKLKPIYAISLTAIAFGVIHLNFLGLIPLIAFGLYFSYIAYKTESIFITVFLHFINNFFTVILFHFTKGSWILDSAPKSELSNYSLIFLFLSNIFLFILSMFALNKIIKLKQIKTLEN